MSIKLMTYPGNTQFSRGNIIQRMEEKFTFANIITYLVFGKTTVPSRESYPTVDFHAKIIWSILERTEMTELEIK